MTNLLNFKTPYDVGFQYTELKKNLKWYKIWSNYILSLTIRNLFIFLNIKSMNYLLLAKRYVRVYIPYLDDPKLINIINRAKIE